MVSRLRRAYLQHGGCSRPCPWTHSISCHGHLILTMLHLGDVESSLLRVARSFLDLFRPFVAGLHNAIGKSLWYKEVYAGLHIPHGGGHHWSWRLPFAVRWFAIDLFSDWFWRCKGRSCCSLCSLKCHFAWRRVGFMRLARVSRLITAVTINLAPCSLSFPMELFVF